MKAVCTTCGRPHERCAGHKDGGPCGRWPTRGATVCKSHGAGSPRVAAKAAVRAEVMRWGLGDTTVDPGEVLLRLLTQSAARAQRYAAEIERLVDDSPNLHAAMVGTIAGEFGEAGEYIRGLAQLEAQERDRCAMFAVKAIAAGLAERTVRVAEQQAGIAERALLAALDDLGLTGDQQRHATARLAHHLRLVE